MASVGPAMLHPTMRIFRGGESAAMFVAWVSKGLANSDEFGYGVVMAGS